MRVNPITQTITQAAVISRLVVMPHDPTASQTEMSERSLDICDLVTFAITWTVTHAPSVALHKLKTLHELPPQSSDWAARQPHAPRVARNDEAPRTSRCDGRAPPRPWQIVARYAAGRPRR
jgi:hypothetical protein